MARDHTGFLDHARSPKDGPPPPLERQGDLGWGRTKGKAEDLRNRQRSTIEARSRGLRWTSRGWVPALVLLLALLGCGPGAEVGGSGGSGGEGGSDEAVASTSASVTTGAGGSAVTTCPDGAHCEVDPQGLPHGSCDDGACHVDAPPAKCSPSPYVAVACAPPRPWGYACADYYSPFIGQCDDVGPVGSDGLVGWCCAW